MDPLKRRSAEARKANVIYFLNRNGHIEHPHLIRIHHFCHSGVHLRDVKRWLSELRGKEMPDSFTWSYQRRYREGFVWQDLVDDDLITPISNYEYVLLGSLHLKASSFSAEPAVAVSTTATNAESKSDFFPFPEVDTSPEKEELFAAASVSAALQPPDEDPLPKEKVEDLGKSPAIVAGGRRYSWRASNYLLCHFLTCSAVETADSAVLETPRRIIAAAGGGHGADRGPHGQVTKTVGEQLLHPPTGRTFTSGGTSDRRQNPTKK